MKLRFLFFVPVFAFAGLSPLLAPAGSRAQASDGGQSGIGGGASSVSAPLGREEIHKRLHDIFETKEDAGPLPSDPRLAQLGISESHLEAAWFDMARRGKTELMEGLVQRGFNPDAANQKGHTALILAVYNDHPLTVRWLMENGANPCLKDKKGNTALMGAAFKGEPSLIEMLAKAGCPVNTQNNAGQTGLMMASLFNRQDAVKILLRLGADSRLKDRAGATALSLAEMQDNPAMIRLLTAAQGYKKISRFPESLKASRLRRWLSDRFSALSRFFSSSQAAEKYPSDAGREP